jgi:hypothetical protein
MNDRRLWKVTLRADDKTYRHLIVSAGDEQEAIESACNIELAPLRAVVKVARYEGN